MKTIIFTKTYKKDYKWLYLLAKSIDKYSQGFDSWYVLYDNYDNPPNVHLNNIKVNLVPVDIPSEIEECPCPFAGHPGLDTVGYNFQQYVKLNWYNFILDNDVETTLQIDSDVICTDYFNPHTVMSYGNPLWNRSVYDIETHNVWGSIVSEFIGKEINYDYMCNGVFLLTKQACIGFNNFVLNRHKINFLDYCMTKKCTEYSFFGAYLDNIYKHNYVVQDMPILNKKIFKKYWSWSDKEYERATYDNC